MKFIPVITSDLSLPVTSCSGNCSIWVWDSSCTGEKTILGRKEKPLGKAREHGQPQSLHWGPEPEPGVGRKNWTTRRSWKSKFPFRLVYKKLKNLQWLQNWLNSHMQSEIKKYFHLLSIPWAIMFFHLLDTRQSEYCFPPKKLCSFISNWNLMNVLFRFIIGCFVLFKLRAFLSLKEIKHFEIH